LSAKVPKFVRQYADLGSEIVKALHAYIADVQSGRFPDAAHTYAMSEEERASFEKARQDLSATKP